MSLCRASTKVEWDISGKRPWAKCFGGSTVSHGLMSVLLITSLNRGIVGMEAQHVCIKAN